MKNKDILQKYASKIATELKPRLRQNIGVDLVVYPTETKGGVVEVKLVQKRAPGTKGVTVSAISPTVNSVLRKIPQRIVAGNIDGVEFAGTNISLEGNRILLIKGDDSHWSEEDAVADLSRALNAHKVA